MGDNSDISDYHNNAVNAHNLFFRSFNNSFNMQQPKAYAAAPAALNGSTTQKSDNFPKYRAPPEDAQMSDRRQETADENPCHSVDAELFLNGTLPPVPNLNAICEEIRTNKAIFTPGLGWKDLLVLSGHEIQAFNKPMEEICKTIITAASPASRKAPPDSPATQSNDSHLKLICDGNRPFISERPSSRRLCAGLCFTPPHRKSKDTKRGLLLNENRVHVEDVVACGEFTKKNSNPEYQDNHAKIMYDGLSLMKDPCRRFTFGFTIVGQEMSFYFFSRNFILKSKGFDMHTQFHHVVHFFAALSLATDEQLGWDLTVRRFVDLDDKIRYQFLVGDKWYQVTGVLADLRAEEITGRATRVWKVVELAANGSVVTPRKEYALKDFWVDANAPQEAITIKSIRALLAHWTAKYLPDATADDLDEVDIHSDCPLEAEWLKELEGDAYKNDAPPNCKNENWHAPYNRYFPKIIAHGYVQLSENKGPDRGTAFLTQDHLTRIRKARSVALFVHPKKPRAPQARISLNEGSTRQEVAGLYFPPFVQNPAGQDGVIDNDEDEDDTLKARFQESVHYREVMEDVATTLFLANSVNDLIDALRDTVIALRWLFRAGYVHRDLSLGNILRVNDSSVDAAHETFTRLSDFEYCKKILSAGPTSTDLKMGTPDFMAVEIQVAEWLFSEDGSAPFTAGPLHDVEPILWMLIWSLVQQPLGPNIGLLPWQQRAYEGLFSQSKKDMFIMNGRRSAPGKLIRHGCAEHPQLEMLLGTQVFKLAQIISNAHTALQDAFGTQDPGSYACTARRTLRDVLQCLDAMKLQDDLTFNRPEPEPVSGPPAPSHKKRPHTIRSMAPTHAIKKPKRKL